MNALVRSPNQIDIAFDEVVYDRDENCRLSEFTIRLDNRNGGQRLQVTSHTANPEHGFCMAGARLQQLEYNNFVPVSDRITSEKPLISCIILLTFNAPFVKNFLLPSIASNTTAPYEIIIVYNGVNTDLSIFSEYKVVSSETGCVSKAYNTGVAHAKGTYIAIFHDDCLLCSPGWQQKMINALAGGTMAVSTESVFNSSFELEFLKGTPLFMRKDDYDRAGGHDEFFFAGIEDLDFSYRMRRAGNNLKTVDFPYRHFNGMSTVILLAAEPEMMRLLFGYCLVPEPVIERWKMRLMNQPETSRMMYAVHGENLAYMMMKSALPDNGCNLTNVQVLTSEQYPALYKIKKTYQDWLTTKFKCDLQVIYHDDTND